MDCFCTWARYWILAWLCLLKTTVEDDHDDANCVGQGVLTSLATFTFTTNFKATSPFAHLLPPWSGLLWSPLDTLSQAISVYKMDVEHRTIQAEEKRLERFGDAYKRHQFRVAHGMKEAPAIGPEANVFVERDRENAALEARQKEQMNQGQEYVDFEGKRRPVKKWLGIW